MTNQQIDEYLRKNAKTQYGNTLLRETGLTQEDLTARVRAIDPYTAGTLRFDMTPEEEAKAVISNQAARTAQDEAWRTYERRRLTTGSPFASEADEAYAISTGWKSAAPPPTTIQSVQPTNQQTNMISQQDYQLKQGETIQQYNARIANLRGIAPVASPVVNSTNKTTQQILEESTRVAQQAAAMIGTTFTPGYASSNGKIAPVSINDTIPTTTKTPDISYNANIDYVSGLQAQVEAQRKSLETAYQNQINSINQQKAEAQAKMDEYKIKEESTLGSMESLSQPYQQALESSERERLKVEENYFANQSSVKELEDLLNQSITDIQSAESVTGLSAIRTPRINKIKEDYEARAGVINAVMAARNNQISVATNLIDRSINAIANDRKSQLDYYSNVLNFYDSLRTEEGNKLITLTNDEKNYVNAQINLIQNDLAQAESTANYVKQLMLDPASAQAMEGAGITLNDSIPQINAKLSAYSYQKEVQDVSNTMATNGYKAILPQQVSSYSSSEVVTLTDSQGNKKYFWKPTSASTTQVASGAETELKNNIGPGGFVDINVYRDIRAKYAGKNVSASTFDGYYSDYLSPTDRAKYGIGTATGVKAIENEGIENPFK